MDNKPITSSDHFRTINIAREKGEHPVPFDLRQGVCQEVIKRIKQLSTLSLNLAQLTEEVVNLIRDSFGFYFVGLYLVLDPGQGIVSIQAGSGEIGNVLVEKRKDRLLLSLTDAPVSEAIKLNEPQLIDDTVIRAKPYLADPLIPDTRLDMALPLRSQQDVIGALRICSRALGSLGREDFTVLMPIADQIAIACTNLLKANSRG